jgi:hypothetical protein
MIADEVRRVNLKVELFKKMRRRRILRKMFDISAGVAFTAIIGLVGTMDTDLSADYTVQIIALAMYLIAYLIIISERN